MRSVNVLDQTIMSLLQGVYGDDHMILTILFNNIGLKFYMLWINPSILSLFIVFMKNSF